MVVVLFLFTLGAISAFGYFQSVGAPFIGLVLLAVLVVLLGAATVVAFQDAHGKSNLF